jgi:hypothetical protein
VGRTELSFTTVTVLLATRTAGIPALGAGGALEKPIRMPASIADHHASMVAARRCSSVASVAAACLVEAAQPSGTNQQEASQPATVPPHVDPFPAGERV